MPKGWKLGNADKNIKFFWSTDLINNLSSRKLIKEIELYIWAIYYSIRADGIFKDVYTYLKCQRRS